MKSFLIAIPCFLVAIHASADNFRLETVSENYSIEVISAELPVSIQGQVKASNLVAKNAAFQKVMEKIQRKCIDQFWPSANQMDIVSVKDEYLKEKSTDKALVRQLELEAVCRTTGN